MFADPKQMAFAAVKRLRRYRCCRAIATGSGQHPL